MKKLITIIIVGMMVPATAQVCRADYKDIPEQVPTTLEVWFGGHGSDHSNSKNTSEAEIRSLPQVTPPTGLRIPGNKAAEYYSLENSPSGGFLYKSAELPNRLHMEFDFYDVDDWYGDFRYSYLDYVQIRLLPRRFYHNLDNRTVFDWVADGDTDIRDPGIDDYGLRIDIDQYKVRFKTPGFPLHVYSEGEYILKEGSKQMRFVTGDARHGGPGLIQIRTSEEGKVDQEKQEYSLGTNAHLGPIELDFSRKWRKFKSDVTPLDDFYGSDVTTEQVHNVVPELEAITDTVRVHTSHSGRIFISGTYSNLEKTNEYSGAEASNEMGYGEVVWLPAGFISFTAKYRHQKNEAEVPPGQVFASDGQSGTDPPTLVGYTPHPGVESTLETYSLGARYSLIPRTSVRLQYTNKNKKVDEQSAKDWSQPLETTNEIYELNLTNWAIPKTRIAAKLKHTRSDFDFIPFLTVPDLETSVNNVPEVVNQGILGLAFMISPRVSMFLNGNLAWEEGKRMRQHIDEDWNLHAEALRQTYVASLAFMVSEKLSFSPTYTFISFKQDRDLIWEDNGGNPSVDSIYENEQTAHNVALTMMYEPNERLSVNASIDYTTTEGEYIPVATHPLNAAIDLLEIAGISATDTEEVNLRLDTDYDLGNSWGVGVDLRFTDWKDTSFDNPYDGTYIGGMLKITKKIM